MAEWEYLKIRELATMLQLNQQTVRRWVNAGELEYVKFGRTKYIPHRAAVALAGGIGDEMPELLTVAQVAGILRVNKQTVRNWIDDWFSLRPPYRQTGPDRPQGFRRVHRSWQNTRGPLERTDQAVGSARRNLLAGPKWRLV